jgi:hypothetical protein
MTVQVWDINTFRTKAADAAAGDLDWLNAVEQLGQRAHARGDGLAIYVNNDLGHPEVGQWQVVSYGGEDAQLETREDYGDPDDDAEVPEQWRVKKAARLGEVNYFVHGVDTLRLILPDIGGRINWRYLLEAIVPSYKQVADEDQTSTEPCPVVGCVYRKGHNIEVFPHRTNAATEPTERLVTLTVKVTGGANEQEASDIVRAAIDNGLEVWSSSGGSAGFSDQDDTGVDTYDRGIRAEVIDAAVI